MGVYNLGGIPLEIHPASPETARFLAPFATDLAPVASLPVPQTEQREITGLFYSLCERMLTPFERLYLHGPALQYGGKAYLFTAPSGVGKSTHLDLWRQTVPNATILSGDKPLLHPTAHGCTLYSTPWQGKEGWGTVGQAPLGGIFVLRRGGQDSVTPLSAAHALPFLLEATWRPTERTAYDQLLTLLDRLLRQVPVYLLTATPTVGAVHAVKTIIDSI